MNAAYYCGRRITRRNQLKENDSNKAHDWDNSRVKIKKTA
jgi:hypothetical protein